MAMQERDGDLVDQIVGYIDRGVGFVRDNATGRIITIVRTVVYGLLAAIIGLVLLTLFTIVLVRLLFLIPGHRAWLAHGIAGLVFVLAGAILMRKRQPKPLN
jgi:hypothetical protein